MSESMSSDIADPRTLIMYKETYNIKSWSSSSSIWPITNHDEFQAIRQPILQIICYIAQVDPENSFDHIQKKNFHSVTSIDLCLSLITSLVVMSSQGFRGTREHVPLLSGNKGTWANILRELGNGTNLGEEGIWKCISRNKGTMPIIFREHGPPSLLWGP